MNPPAIPSSPGFGPDMERFLERSPPRDGVVRIDAAGVFDAAGTAFSPGSMLLEVQGIDVFAGRYGWPLCGRGQVLVIGSSTEVDRHPAARSAARISVPHCVLIPGLVNAHSHLDLTHIGPREFEEARGFEGWIEMVRLGRAHADDAIEASVRAGIELSLAGGTVAVGDIAGANAGGPNLTAWRTLRDSPLVGTSFLEFFAIGTREAAGVSRMRELVDIAVASGASGDERVRLGLQPHAPNTVSVAAYVEAARFARACGTSLCTHLAESPAEHEFIGLGTGPFRALLERLGLWDQETCAEFGKGRTPIGHLERVLARAKFLLAHVNDANDEDLEVLARTGQTVVYCPRASEYFGNHRHFGPHRYREMQRRGIRVALGTDSIINLPPERCGQSSGGLGVLDEMRLLFRRDGTDATELLSMGTLDGAEALGLALNGFQFVPGAQPYGVVAVPVDVLENPGATLHEVLGGDSPPRLLFIRK